MDFGEGASDIARDVNAWISDRTKKKIPMLLTAGDIDTETLMVIVNAVYFKGQFHSCKSFRLQVIASNKAADRLLLESMSK